MGSSSAFSTPTAVCGKLVDRPPWPPQPRVDCSKPIWTSSWADHQQPALVHLPLTLCDRPLGPLLLPLLLHQVTLEQGAVSNAAAVATEGQQRRHAPMQELQHTRFPWQLARLALHQRHVLRHPPHHHQLCQHGRSSLWKEKPVFGPPSASLMARAAAWKASTKVRSDMAMHHHHPPPHHYHPQLQRFEHRSFAWSALGAGTPGRPSSPTMQVHADVTRTSALTTPGGEQIWRDVFAPPRITQSVKVTYVCIAQCFSLARLHHWSHISQELEVLDHHHKIALKCFLRL